MYELLENVTNLHCNPFRLILVLNLAFAPFVSLNGTLVEAKIRTFKGPRCVFLASPSVPLRPTTKQMPNLALIKTKRITVCI